MHHDLPHRRSSPVPPREWSLTPRPQAFTLHAASALAAASSFRSLAGSVPSPSSPNVTNSARRFGFPLFAPYSPSSLPPWRRTTKTSGSVHSDRLRLELYDPRGVWDPDRLAGGASPSRPFLIVADEEAGAVVVQVWGGDSVAESVSRCEDMRG